MLEAKIVTANGDVVIASEYQNDDLFYAMRGGVESVQEFLWDLAIMHLVEKKLSSWDLPNYEQPPQRYQNYNFESQFLVLKMSLSI